MIDTDTTGNWILEWEWCETDTEDDGEYYDRNIDDDVSTEGGWEEEYEAEFGFTDEEMVEPKGVSTTTDKPREVQKHEESKQGFNLREYLDNEYGYDEADAIMEDLLYALLECE